MILKKVDNIEKILRKEPGGDDCRWRTSEVWEACAGRRLERMEKEEEHKEDESNRDGFVACTVKKWFVEKGFGFIMDDSGMNVFLHVSVMPGSAVPVVGSKVHVKLMQDVSRADCGWKAVEAFTEVGWRDRHARQRAARAADKAALAATVAAQMAVRCRDSARDMLETPPRLRVASVVPPDVTAVAGASAAKVTTDDKMTKRRPRNIP